MSSLLGVACVAAYVLPLYRPPPPRALLAPGAGANLLERIFPDVPLVWVLGRLVLLAVGAVLLVRGAPALPPRPEPAAHPLPRTGAVWAWLACAIAAFQAILALGAARLDRSGQTLLFFSLPLPALLLALSTPGAPLPRRPGTRGAAVATAGVIAAWLLTRVPVTINALRGASVTDGWVHIEWIARAAMDDSNVLTGQALLGGATNYFFLFGLPFLGEGRIPPNLPWLQGWILLWGAVTAALLGSVTARALRPAAAPVAAAAFLFAPLILTLPIGVIPLTGMTALTAALALAFQRVQLRGSHGALVLAGPLAGIAAGQAQVAHVALLAAGCLGVLAWRRRRDFPLPVWAACALGLFAAAWPAVPELGALDTMSRHYVDLEGEYATLQNVIFGQVPPYPAVWDAWRMERTGPFDVPVAALLAPFVIARTALRLWGDALFEPIATVLFALGIGWCVREARGDARARAWLLLLGFLLLPGLTSSFDRPSHTRLVASAVAFAALAGLGFELLRARFAPGGGALLAAGAALGIAASGSLLFDRVNPAILPASFSEIALEARGRQRLDADAVLWSHAGDRDVGWFHLESIGSALPPQPLPVVPYAGPESAAAYTRARGEPAGWFWSPGLEQELLVSRGLCLLWPDAALYELRDRTGLSRAFAAVPRHDPGDRTTWTPRLPPGRMRVLGCGDLSVFGLM